MKNLTWLVIAMRFFIDMVVERRFIAFYGLVGALNGIADRDESRRF